MEAPAHVKSKLEMTQTNLHKLHFGILHESAAETDLQSFVGQASFERIWKAFCADTTTTKAVLEMLLRVRYTKNENARTTGKGGYSCEHSLQASDI